MPNYGRKKDEKESTYDMTNFWGRLFQSFITPFLVGGLKKNFKVEEIPSLPKKYRSENMFVRYQRVYSNVKKKTRFGIIVSILLFFRKRIIIAMILSIVSFLVGMTIPFIQRIILFNIFPTERTAQWMKDDFYAVLAAGIVSFAMLTATFLDKYFTEITGEVTLNILNILNSTYYSKILKLPLSEMNKQISAVSGNEKAKKGMKGGTGGKRRGDSLLYTINVELIIASFGIQSIIHLLLIPLKLSIATGFLLYNFGWTSVFAIMAAVILFPFLMFFLVFYTMCFKSMMSKERIHSNKISDILKGMKYIKMNVMESVLIKKLLKFKRGSLVSVFLYILSFLFSIFFVLFTNTFIQCLVLSLTWILYREKFSIGDVIPSLHYVKYFSRSLSLIPFATMRCIQSYTSLLQFQEVMNLKEKVDTDTSLDPSNNISIHVDNCTFKWTKEELTTAANKCQDLCAKKIVSEQTVKQFENVSLKVKRGNLIGITGKNASGKSSLILALLDEMKKENGKVKINGKLSVCFQQAFIENETVLNNILFGKKYDKKKVAKILNACAFMKEVNGFQYGIQTEIGDNGCTLSGGQKGRLQIARTCYNEADIYIFDDIFATLDARVRKHVIDKVVNGILKNKTRLIVTTQPKLLKRCDEIIVIDDFKIVEHDTYSVLKKMKGSFFNKLLKEKHGKSGKSKKVLNLAEEAGKELDNVGLTDIAGGGRLIIDEKFSTGVISLKTIWFYFKHFGFRFKKRWLKPLNYVLSPVVILFTVVCCFTFTELFKKFMSYWLLFWVADEFNFVGGNEYLVVYNVMGFTFPVVVFIFVFVICFVSMNAVYRIYSKVVKSLFYSPMRYFYIVPLGRIVNVFNVDGLIVYFLIMTFVRLSVAVLRIATFLVNLVVSSYLSIIPILFVLGVLFVVQELYRRSSRQLLRLQRVAQSGLVSFFLSCTSGLSTIRNCNAEDFFFRKLHEKNDNFLKVNFQMVHTNIWKDVRFGVVSFAFSFIFCTLLIILGNYEFGYVLLSGLSILEILDLASYFNHLVDMLAKLEFRFVSLERMKHYATDLISEKQDLGVKDPDQSFVIKSPSIEFKNVFMRYRKDSPLVLKDLSFRIQAREKIAIVGRTGAGKSSVIETLMRTCILEDGQVRIGGKNIVNVELKTLRSQISVLTQEPFLFQDSIRFNLDPFDKYTDQQIWDALGVCKLKPVILLLNGHLDAKIRTNDMFSIGQKFLLNFARIILDKSKIICLDEVTSQLDFETSQLVGQVLNSHLKDSTILFITHKLDESSMNMFDRVLKIRNGRLAEMKVKKAEDK